jgi:putative aldouronate transport system permease protein
VIHHRYEGEEMKKSLSYQFFSIGNIIFFVLLAIVMIFPLYKVVVTSLITPTEIYASPLTLWPKHPTILSYRFVFANSDILHTAWNTVFITIAGTFISMIVTLALAYALSKNFLPGGKFIHRLILLTMFLDTGLIPFFLMVRNLGLTNNIWVNIVPALVSLWNYLVIRSFFKQLPQSLEEAAIIDGAGWFKLFVRIVLPLSMPVVATFTLFYAVGYWNTWYYAMLFCNNPDLQTLQLLLRRLVVSNESVDKLMAAFQSMAGTSGRYSLFNESMKMANCVIATVPILLVYPFLQKYFVKGVMIGAIKG